MLQRELIQENRARHKWTRERAELQVGDIVNVLDQKNDRGMWPVGRILSISQSEDGRGRQATVKVGTKAFQRPILRLIPLSRE